MRWWRTGEITMSDNVTVWQNGAVTAWSLIILSKLFNSDK